MKNHKKKSLIINRSSWLDQRVFTQFSMPEMSISSGDDGGFVDIAGHSPQIIENPAPSYLGWE